MVWVDHRSKFRLPHLHPPEKDRAMEGYCGHSWVVESIGSPTLVLVHIILPAIDGIGSLYGHASGVNFAS